MQTRNCMKKRRVPSTRMAHRKTDKSPTHSATSFNKNWSCINCCSRNVAAQVAQPPVWAVWLDVSRKEPMPQLRKQTQSCHAALGPLPLFSELSKGRRNTREVPKRYTLGMKATGGSFWPCLFFLLYIVDLQ